MFNLKLLIIMIIILLYGIYKAILKEMARDEIILLTLLVGGFAVAIYFKLF
jgi:hypothetical protein